MGGRGEGGLTVVTIVKVLYFMIVKCLNEKKSYTESSSGFLILVQVGATLEGFP